MTSSTALLLCSDYLLALFLGEVLSLPTTLSLSKSIYEQKSAYYKAFDEAENVLNHGELTQFVYSLLDMTSKAQDRLVAQFIRASERLTETGAAIEAYAASHGLSSKESNAVFVLTQATVFSEDGDVSLREISEQLGIGEQMARSHMRKLEKEGIARRIRKRDPITFALTEQFTEAIGVQRFE